MNRATLFLLAAVSLVAGCDNSSGLTGNGGNNPPSDDSAPITSANAVEITRLAFGAALTTIAIGDLSGGVGGVAAVPGGVNKLDTRMSAASMAGYRSQDPLPPLTTPCDISGSVTISGDVADVITFNLSPGDFFDMQFDMCSDVQGEVTDGDLHMDVDDFSGNFLGGLYNLTMTLTLTDFQVTTPEDTVTGNGDATVSLDTVNAPDVAASVSGSSLTFDANASSETITSFSSAQSFNGSVFPSPFTMSASGTLDSTQLPGLVRYSTPVTLAGFDAEFPGTGEFLVTGAESSARLVVESNVSVRIEIDTDGDGTVNETINTTWAELSM